MRYFCQFGLLLLLNVILLLGCVEPYPPPVSDDEAGYLVVDGYVNSTEGSVHVKLSRAVPLASTEPPPAETQAMVRLEDNDGNIFSLIESISGNYTATGLTIDITKKYRLFITTQDNKVYASDFVILKETPPIDELTWTPLRDGVKILLTTHDDSQQSIYYKWEFEETYEQHPAYYSYYKKAEDIVVMRQPEDNIYYCWKTDLSKNIIIGSSSRLSSDIISDFPITFLPVGTEKLYVRYSILVKQRTLTQEAHAFYDQLKKTTEELGGLFDPQPGQVLGNIRCLSNPNEIVVGYFEGGSEVQERIFIKPSDLPPNLKIRPGPGNCILDTLSLEDVPDFSDYSVHIVDALYGLGSIVGYTYSTSYCTDCRLQGGTTNKPDFW